jgi:alpha-L-rhamnosidase
MIEIIHPAKRIRVMHQWIGSTIVAAHGRSVRCCCLITIRCRLFLHARSKYLLWLLMFPLAWPLWLKAVNVPTGLLCNLLEHPDETVVSTNALEFGWVCQPSFRDDSQTGFRIIVASSAERAAAGEGDVWDSGVVSNSASINVPYDGPALGINRNYYWRVQTMDGAGKLSPFSAAQHFLTGSTTNLWADRYPPRFVAACPVLCTNTAPGRWFIDFGQDAFGYIHVRLKGHFRGTGVTAVFSEMAKDDAAAPGPPGSFVRYGATTFTLQNGDVTYAVRPPIDTATINPPPAYGNVMPFRYLELINYPGPLTSADVVQKRLATFFDTNAASFSSSSPALDRIWALCRNSMEWLSFDGIYVDGDRERKPYEADTYIHQMSSYAVNNDFTTPRYSFEYLTAYPTWPTEWKFHMILIAWEDYLHTGNCDLLRKYYDVLRADSFMWAATGDGLMRGFPGFPQTSNSDVVDWPAGDRDGFVGLSRHGYRNWTNAVNNAFYYRCLRIMAQMADVIGRSNDAAIFTAKAGRAYRVYNSTFWDPHSQSYVDGVGTTHSSAHANFFPLAFGLVPADRQAAVVRFLHSRIAANGGMPCSVYGAQFLLEALFEAGDSDTALDLMATNSPRSWMNMINMGSTLTTEAWNFQDKPNLDWNHAWGAAPGNLIARYVLGLRPMSPGFGRIIIQPHLGNILRFARGVVPTVRGPVTICATNEPGRFQLWVNIPDNVTATVMLPSEGMSHPETKMDGHAVSGSVSNHWLVIPNVGSGYHDISLDVMPDDRHTLERTR